MTPRTWSIKGFPFSDDYTPPSSNSLCPTTSSKLKNPLWPHLFGIFRSMIHCNGIQGSNEREAQDFFDAIDALNLAEVPSAAGQKYFGRFVRWALREFLADAQGTVSQARTIPGEGIPGIPGIIDLLLITQCTKIHEICLQDGLISLSSWTHRKR